MYALGITAAEVDILHKMNSDSIPYVDTPYELSKKIEIASAARQGTIFGPCMCVKETDKINSINQRTYTMVGGSEYEIVQTIS